MTDWYKNLKLFKSQTRLTNKDIASLIEGNPESVKHQLSPSYGSFPKWMKGIINTYNKYYEKSNN